MSFFPRYYKSYAGFILFACFILSIESKAEVILNTFEVTSKGNFIVIQWKTASESDIRGFYILSSTDNKKYEILGTLIPCLKCNTEGANYSATHIQAQPGRTYSYVLKSVNNTGDSILTDPVLFTFNQASEPNHRETTTPSFQSTLSDSTAMLDSHVSIKKIKGYNAFSYANRITSNAIEIPKNSSINLQNTFSEDKPLRNHVSSGSTQVIKDSSTMKAIQSFRNLFFRIHGLFLLAGILMPAVLWIGIHYFKR
jgi:hypothetical protein